MYRKLKIAYFIFYIFFVVSSSLGQSKTVVLNKYVKSVETGRNLYLKTITLNRDYYIMDFYFTTNYPILEGKYLINNSYVENYVPVKVEGITLGKMYLIKGIPKILFKVTVPRKYKELVIDGRGIARIDLSEFDSFLPLDQLEDLSKDTMRPVVNILSPNLSNEIYRTHDFSIILKGKTSDNEGIYQVYINDKIASLNENGYFQKRLKLKIGKNPILLEVIDINDNKTTKEFTIIRDEFVEEDEFSDVDFAFETNLNKPNAIAVVIGIEEYQYAPNVSNAYNDAEIMREYLISTFGLKRENIYFRYNERATKGEFEKIFSKNGWISKNSNIDSEIYIFYAGHGVASVNDGSSYLIPSDIDPNYPQTGYSLEKLYKNLSEIKAKQKNVFIDACFSGLSRENESLLADARPVGVKIKDNFVPDNMNVFTASNGNEISSSYKEKSHGLFTYYLLKGLNRNADANNDKKITIGELFQYLSQNVNAQAKKMGREQNPQIYSSNKNEVLLNY